MSRVSVVGARQGFYESVVRIRPVVLELVSHDGRRGETVRLRDSQGRGIWGQLG